MNASLTRRLHRQRAIRALQSAHVRQRTDTPIPWLTLCLLALMLAIALAV